jgi:hypothetical protein
VKTLNRILTRVLIGAIVGVIAAGIYGTIYGALDGLIRGDAARVASSTMSFSAAGAVAGAMLMGFDCLIVPAFIDNSNGHRVDKKANNTAHHSLAAARDLLANWRRSRSRLPAEPAQRAPTCLDKPSTN